MFEPFSGRKFRMWVAILAPTQAYIQSKMHEKNVIACVIEFWNEENRNGTCKAAHNSQLRTEYVSVCVCVLVWKGEIYARNGLCLIHL